MNQAAVTRRDLAQCTRQHGAIDLSRDFGNLKNLFELAFTGVLALTGVDVGLGGRAKAVGQAVGDSQALVGTQLPESRESEARCRGPQAGRLYFAPSCASSLQCLGPSKTELT